MYSPLYNTFSFSFFLLLFFYERKTGGVTRLMLLSDLKGKIICIKEKDMVVITGLFKPAWRAVLLL